MRELKFRMWRDGRMQQLHEMHTDKSSDNCFQTAEQYGVIMQFSGELDGLKNSIYEGDFIQIDGGAEEKPVGEIIFEDGCFCFKAPWKDRSYPELKYYTNMKFMSIRIIGNRFENPELLK